MMDVVLVIFLAVGAVCVILFFDRGKWTRCNKHRD